MCQCRLSVYFNNFKKINKGVNSTCSQDWLHSNPVTVAQWMWKRQLHVRRLQMTYSSMQQRDHIHSIWIAPAHFSPSHDNAAGTHYSTDIIQGMQVIAQSSHLITVPRPRGPGKSPATAAEFLTPRPRATGELASPFRYRNSWTCDCVTSSL